jgi:class 3 adenylate cyclase
MSETRKIAAILVADVVGYSRLAGADEEGTLARLRALRSDLIVPTIAARHGRVVKRTGDGIIIEFRSVVDAVRCAIEVQSGMIERNAGLPPETRIEFRVGIISATSSRKPTATSWATASTSPPAWRASRSPATSAFPSKPTGKSRGGSI